MDSGKHMFPGGNTSKGFVNYFNGIIPPWETNKRTYVLKGGPGVGKNTFMRLLGKNAERKGYETEYYHCASDMESLDAVRIPKLGIMMLDGTAPHVIDPVVPGAIDGIINLGVYLNEEQLEKNRAAVEVCLKENSFCYQNTFAYLRAAGELQQNLDKFYFRTLNKMGVEKAVQKLLMKYIPEAAQEKNEFCHLFAAAITPQGYVDYADTIIREDKIIRLKGPLALCIDFIQYAKTYLEFKGYGGHLFYDPLLPENPVHLIVDKMSFCITTEENKINHLKETIDLTEYVDASFLLSQKEIMEFHEQQIETLRERAIKSLKESKKIHDDLEEIYKKSMDFKSATEYTYNFIQKVIG